MLQRQTALNPEHRNLLISILVGNIFPDMKKQIEDNVVGWVDQPMMSFKLQSQFLEKLKATVLMLLVFAKPEMQLWEHFKVHLFFLPILKPPVFILKGL